MSIEDLLNKRQEDHGVFEHNASVSQDLKNIMRPIAQARLSEIQMEALDMISSKIARILTGNPSHIDHWDDISGYATLVSNFLKQQEPH